METQLKSIIKNFQDIEIYTVNIDHLTKTLKTSFDKSTADSQNCDYLDSIIAILRKDTHILKQKTFSLNDKLFRYANTTKFPLHK